MRKNNCLFILTAGFPCDEKSEPYLWNELPYLVQNFDQIYFLPQKGSLPVRKLPPNCSILPPPEFIEKQSIFIYFKILRWVLADVLQLLNQGLVLKLLRYNFSLLLQNYAKAHYYNKKILEYAGQAYLYSYWSSDTATVAAIIKHLNPTINAFSRAHGFDVFEDQTLHHFIPFRKLQLKYLSAIYSVSKRGQTHIQLQFPAFKSKVKCSYLGTKDFGIAPFTPNTEFSIATCSFIRNVKRLDKLVDALHHITIPITWHVIGSGPDVETLRSAAERLPVNVKVNFYGFLNEEELISFYRHTQVNILVSLSTSEGLPVSFMEAISYGIPILSTNVGGCSEIVTHSTGMLIDKDATAEQIARAIVSFKDSEMNTQAFRLGVKRFWEENFNARVNYTKFVSEIIHKPC